MNCYLENRNLCSRPSLQATALADGFIDFFTTKIDKIMPHLTTQLVANKINPEDNNETTFSTDKRLKSSMPIFHCNIESLVKSTPSKSCKLDPIPTKLLKNNISHPSLSSSMYYQQKSTRWNIVLMK